MSSIPTTETAAPLTNLLKTTTVHHRNVSSSSALPGLVLTDIGMYDGVQRPRQEEMETQQGADIKRSELKVKDRKSM